MNHYPSPRKIDRKLHTSTSLTPVHLGTAPTWYVHGSKQEKLLRLAAKVSGRPLDSFNGQHDIILYKNQGFTPIKTKVVDIPSDHRAILSTFKVI